MHVVDPALANLLQQQQQQQQLQQFWHKKLLKQLQLKLLHNALAPVWGSRDRSVDPAQLPCRRGQLTQMLH